MTMVQALRGIAAFWVVLFHAAQGGHIEALLAAVPGIAPAFTAGHYGVAIFFALSGFVIAHSLRDAQVDGRYFGRFLLRRSFRLDPPYWGAILICVILSVISARLTHAPVVYPSNGSTVAHIFYLQELLRYPEINPVFWTLTYEIQFYAVLCGGMAIVGRRPVGFVLLFALAIYAVFSPIIIHGLFVSLWHTFFIGALAYWSLTNPVLRWPLAALSALMILPLGHDYAFGLVSACTALLLFAAGMTGKLYTLLNWRWLQWLGLTSYSLYLLHNPVTGAVGFVVRKVMGEGLLASSVSLAAVVVASVAVAGLYYYAVELPSHRLSRKVKLTSRAYCASASASSRPA